MERWVVVLSRRLWSDLIQGVGKPCSQAGQKGPRCEAREKSTSGGVLRQYVGARRLSATKQMGLFQRSVIRNKKDAVER